MATTNCSDRRVSAPIHNRFLSSWPKDIESDRHRNISNQIVGKKITTIATTTRYDAKRYAKEATAAMANGFSDDLFVMHVSKSKSTKQRRRNWNLELDYGVKENTNR